MNRKNFLNYSQSTEATLDEWIRRAIAVHVYLNVGESEQGLRDTDEIEYEVELSMRQWGIRNRGDDYRAVSRWAVADGDLIIDSLMRDQHVVTLRPLRAGSGYLNTGPAATIEGCLKTSFAALSPRHGEPELFSLSTFDKLHVLSEIGMSSAISQVRWLEIPGVACEGVFFTSTKGNQVFVPLQVDPRITNDFSSESEYRREYVFEFVRDRRLLGD